MKHFLCATLFFPLALLAQIPVPSSRNSDYIMESAPSVPRLSKEDTYIRTSNGKAQILKGDDTPISDFYEAIEHIYGGSDNQEKVYIAKKGGAYGLLDKLGKPIGNFEYEKIKLGNDGAILAQKKGLWGIINKKNETLVPYVFSTIYYYNSATNQLLASKNGSTNEIYAGSKQQPINIDNATFTKVGVMYPKDGKWFIMNGQNKNILHEGYDQIKITGTANYDMVVTGTKVKYIQTPKPYFLVRKDKMWGIVDYNGKINATLQYDDIAYDTSRSLYSLTKGKLKGLFFPGEPPVLIDAVYQGLYPSYNNAIVAIKDGKYGLLDKKGNPLLPFQYDSMMEYNTNRYLVTQNKKEGMVDGKGKILIPINNDDVTSFGGFNFSDYYTIKKDELYGIVKSDGQIILPVKYDWVGDYDNIIVGEKSKQWTLFDRVGFQIYPETIDYLARNFADKKVFYLVKNKKLGLINSEGKILAKPIYKDFDFIPDENNIRSPYSSPYLLVTDESNKKGLFDERSQKFKIQPSYDDLKQTDGQFIVAKKGAKFGIIDDSNRIIIPFDYDDLSLGFISSKNQYFVAKKGTKYGIINAKNEIKTPFEYQNLARISSENLFKANKGKGYQLINSENKIISTATFQEILNFEGKSALAFQNGKMITLSSDGKVTNTEIKATVPDGFKTFNELKSNLVKALDTKDDTLLKEFCRKIAPNPAMLFYLKNNIYNESSTEYLDANAIATTYFNELLNFKVQMWQNQKFDRQSLIDTKEFEIYDNGKVVSVRDGIINDYREEILNNILKECVKVNGFWYSSYFMKPRFGRY